MKRSLLLLALSGALAVAPSAFAHGGWRHGDTAVVGMVTTGDAAIGLDRCWELL